MAESANSNLTLVSTNFKSTAMLAVLESGNSNLTFRRRDLNWLQSTFAYDIIFAWRLNFCTWFTKNFIISGTKKDLIMD